LGWQRVGATTRKDERVGANRGAGWVTSRVQRARVRCLRSRADTVENQDLQQAFDIQVRVCYTSPSRGQPWPWAAVIQKEATTMSIETTVYTEECRDVLAMFFYLSRCKVGAARWRLA
jgi:hypothetical protein